MEMAVKSMETAVESMETALGALPYPGRVPEQTFVPRNWSSTAAVMRNFSGENTD
jgi:hypothetical protein